MLNYNCFVTVGPYSPNFNHMPASCLSSYFSRIAITTEKSVFIIDEGINIKLNTPKHALYTVGSITVTAKRHKSATDLEVLF